MKILILISMIAVLITGIFVGIEIGKNRTNKFWIKLIQDRTEKHVAAMEELEKIKINLKEQIRQEEEKIKKITGVEK